LWLYRFNYKETFEGADRGALLLCADYHQKTHMLVAGFSNGHFYLHEMPDFNIIHSLRFTYFLFWSASIYLFRFTSQYWQSTTNDNIRIIQSIGGLDCFSLSKSWSIGCLGMAKSNICP
jgi:hypothetical protein